MRARTSTENSRSPSGSSSRCSTTSAPSQKTEPSVAAFSSRPRSIGDNEAMRAWIASSTDIGSVASSARCVSMRHFPSGPGCTVPLAWKTRTSSSMKKGLPRVSSQASSQSSAGSGSALASRPRKSFSDSARVSGGSSRRV